MRSLGSDDSNDKCPQCRLFLANADIIIHKMENIERKMESLKNDLYTYEWTIIENSENIKNMRKNGFDSVDKESFDVAFDQSKRFLRLLETIESSLNSMERRYNDVNGSLEGDGMGYV